MSNGYSPVTGMHETFMSCDLKLSGFTQITGSHETFMFIRIPGFAVRRTTDCTM